MLDKNLTDFHTGELVEHKQIGMKTLEGRIEFVHCVEESSRRWSVNPITEDVYKLYHTIYGTTSEEKGTRKSTEQATNCMQCPNENQKYRKGLI